jgi:hypothetical protein
MSTADPTAAPAYWEYLEVVVLNNGVWLASNGRAGTLAEVTESGGSGRHFRSVGALCTQLDQQGYEYVGLLPTQVLGESYHLLFRRRPPIATVN